MRHILLFLSLFTFSVFAWADMTPQPLAPVVTATPETPTPPTVSSPTTTPVSTNLPASVAPAIPSAPAKPIINETQVAVLDESSNSLQLGLQAAFSEVMIKTTGNPKIMMVPAVKMAASNIAQIVQSYSFSQETSAIPPARPSIMLDVVFNQDALQQLMQVVNKTTDNNTPPPPVTTQVKLFVTGVKNMGDYATLMQTLRGTSDVNSVTVNSVDPDRIALTLDVNGGSAQLKTGLSTNVHFKPLIANTGANETELYYLWTDQP